MAQNGYFILTDISGYTEFLTKSELDHAHEALQNLFEAQLAEIRHPFKISGFRGDAIFMYVPDTDFCEPQTFLEALERLYIVFADTRRQMIYNTTCPCRACQNMSRLDLKMVIHHGQYIVQKLGEREELLGPDVIVPHRMLKNSVIEKTGIESYALFSEAAAQASRLSELAFPLVPHVETYEHLGEVKMQVLDLHEVWEREQEKNRFAILPEEAWLTVAWEMPHPLATVWEYMNMPNLQLQWTGFDIFERTGDLSGRMRTESTIHCAHGDMNTLLKILDWKPFEYVTVESEMNDGMKMTMTRWVEVTETGTRVLCSVPKPFEDANDETKEFVAQGANMAMASLQKFLDEMVKPLEPDAA